MTKNKNLRKNFLWNTVGSTLYAFTSLIFLVAVTRINGLDDAGVFTFAFSNACVFVIIGNFAGRIFQVTEKEGCSSESDFFYNRLISVGMMSLLGTAYGLVKGYNAYKFAIVVTLILFKAFEALAEFYYGVIQKKGEIHYVGKSFLMKALFCTVIFVGVDVLTKNILLASLAMTVVSAGILLLYDMPLSRKMGFRRSRFKSESCMRIFKTGFLVFAINLLTQYLINSPKYAIDDLASPDQQTIYGILSMPATVMVLVSNLLVHPVVNDIKEYVESKNKNGLSKLVRRLNVAVLLAGLVCIAGAALLAVPVFKIIYGVDISGMEWPLTMILVGASLYSIVFVLENVLVTLRAMKGQAIVFGAISIVSLAMSRVLVAREAIWGGSIAYLSAMTLLLLLYTVIYFVAISRNIGRGKK